MRPTLSLFPPLLNLPPSRRRRLLLLSLSPMLPSSTLAAPPPHASSSTSHSSTPPSTRPSTAQYRRGGQGACYRPLDLLALFPRMRRRHYLRLRQRRFGHRWHHRPVVSIVVVPSCTCSPARARGRMRQRCAEDPHALGCHLLRPQPQQIVPKALLSGGKQPQIQEDMAG